MQLGRALLVILAMPSVACVERHRLVTPDRAVSPGGAQTSSDPAPVPPLRPPPPGLPSSPATPAPKQRAVIIAGRIFDAKAAKLVAGPHAIVIEGDRIVSVGPSSAVQPVAGETRIDLSAATVLPGLIDVHTHLTSNPEQIGYQSLGISVPRRA